MGVIDPAGDGAGHGAPSWTELSDVPRLEGQVEPAPAAALAPAADEARLPALVGGV